MIIVSYDIADDKMRTRFSKMLAKHGAIRLQYSVYEIKNTKRIVDNMLIKIGTYAKHFTMDDSVVIFDVADNAITKFGNSVHRDRDVVFL